MSTPSSSVLPSQMTTCGPTKIPYLATSSAGMTLVESVTSAIGATGLLLQHAAGQVGNRPEVSNPPDGPPSRRLSVPFRETRPVCPEFESQGHRSEAAHEAAPL